MQVLQSAFLCVGWGSPVTPRSVCMILAGFRDAIAESKEGGGSGSSGQGPPCRHRQLGLTAGLAVGQSERYAVRLQAPLLLLQQHLQGL